MDEMREDDAWHVSLWRTDNWDCISFPMPVKSQGSVTRGDGWFNQYSGRRGCSIDWVRKLLPFKAGSRPIPCLCWLTLFIMHAPAKDYRYTRGMCSQIDFSVVVTRVRVRWISSQVHENDPGKSDGSQIRQSTLSRRSTSPKINNNMMSYEGILG